MIGGVKVVSREEMAQAEKGGDSEWFMQNAGKQIARAVISFAELHKLDKRVTLLVGRGNNGGDAYVAGLQLLQAGYVVKAVVIEGKCSPLNRKFGEQFRKKGQIGTALEGILVDGLLGTGFRGPVEKEMARLIQRANQSKLPILSVDVPSGLDCTTGEANVAIIATETIALEFAKIGFFIRKGWNHVGRIRVVDFGLSKEKVKAVEPLGFIPKTLQLPKIDRIRHKYEAGLVVGFAGSKKYPGAAKLAGRAALGAGAGMVRILSLDPIGECPHELIAHIWTAKEWKEACRKAKAVFVGSGLGKPVNAVLKTITLPCVIDADALVANACFPKEAILTPHRGEMLRLLKLSAMPPESELFTKVAQFVKERKVIVVLKGAPTFIFAPNLLPIIIPRGDPGMATAGTGDVLTGIIAAFLAQGMNSVDAAVLGATLHAMAGEEAAKVKTSYCTVAHDLIQFMPSAVRSILLGHDIV